MEINTFDIVKVDFGNVVFAGEQGGVRPAVVIQNAYGNIYSGTTIVIPFTTQIKHIQQPTHSFFYKDIEKGLMKNSMLLGECVRQVSKKRIKKKLGTITKLQEKKKVKAVYDANFGLIEEVKMEYMIMSLEDANKVAKKDAIVLVAKQDLEESDCNVAFSKKRFGECKNILEEAKIIAKVCDEFSAQLMAFSETQADIINYSNKGKLTTMLFSKLE